MAKQRRDEDPDHIEEKELLRYLDGEMNSEERHAFERRLEKDPFAYEAVEGFESADKKAVSQDLNQMRAEKQPWKNKPPMVMGRIAAVVALMIVATTAAWWLTSDEMEPVAQREVVPADSAAIALQQGEEVPERGTESPTPVMTEPATPESEPATQPPAEAAGPATDASPIEQIVVADEPEERHSFEADEAQKEAGDDYHDQQEAIAAELSEGTFEEQLEAKPEAQQEQLQEALAEKEEARPTAGPVAVVSESAASKKASGAVARSASSTANRAAEESIPAETAAPDMGWDEFNRYVRANQQKSAEMVRGEVKLSFIVDADGKPSRIEVVKPLCEPCNAEAVRLLESSGSWSYYSHITGTPKSLVNIKIRK